MKNQPSGVPLNVRWLFFAGAWVAAYLGVAIILPLFDGMTPKPRDLLICAVCFWLFPAGLIAWFDPSPTLGWVALVWLAYLVHGIFTLRSETTARFYTLLAILAVVLIFNAVGCHRYPVPMPFL
jgi:hypothetical protein